MIFSYFTALIKLSLSKNLFQLDFVIFYMQSIFVTMKVLFLNVMKKNHVFFGGYGIFSVFQQIISFSDSLLSGGVMLGIIRIKLFLLLG